MAEPNPFNKLEDEIILRRALRSVYEHEGMIGIYACMAELNRSLSITTQYALELLKEEDKKNEGI